jgi:ATP-dependent protease HslVU (ClpYQ) peptidase subunit
MTVIAYRAGIMACDSCWTYGDTQVASLIKIKRLSSGALLGQAGDNDARAMEELLDKIKDPRKLPTREQLAKTLTDFIGLVALPKGGVYVIASGPVDQAGWPTESGDCGVWPAASMGGYAAVGSGSDHALAAMDAGATAKEAVQIACRRNVNCRAPVHIMKLHLPTYPLKGKKSA